MILIYLFIKKEVSIYFLNFICIQFKKKLFTLIISKEFITKFQFGHKNYFYLLLLEMIFYNFIYKSILINFHLKKVICTHYLKRHNFICKINFN